MNSLIDTIKSQNNAKHFDLPKGDFLMFCNAVADATPSCRCEPNCLYHDPDRIRLRSDHRDIN